uniref:Uncharacterized protein n=1 Tax=Chromera velia CCMP2878 TaxID=1169474 RepID=A0A0G4HAU5_9ALVE|eukprot:Cvel_25761.t1-p1 / transcript=Cvel_25761.t1 / gene=Cvel_25761 / organism=Chromera_velia_CCMP2878 / gene_product=hypothetical protein / transcript_product=hypothetical protein / location=Cvel_scaffold2967:3959-5154(-) / protein_length=177 / sequence_SO=supercontig / SO=protein_coding / is_pseudo=false
MGGTQVFVLSLSVLSVICSGAFLQRQMQGSSSSTPPTAIHKFTKPPPKSDKSYCFGKPCKTVLASDLSANPPLAVCGEFDLKIGSASAVKVPYCWMAANQADSIILADHITYPQPAKYSECASDDTKWSCFHCEFGGWDGRVLPALTSSGEQKSWTIEGAKTDIPSDIPKNDAWGGC